MFFSIPAGQSWDDQSLRVLAFDATPLSINAFITPMGENVRSVTALSKVYPCVSTGTMNAATFVLENIRFKTSTVTMESAVTKTGAFCVGRVKLDQT